MWGRVLRRSLAEPDARFLCMKGAALADLAERAGASEIERPPPSGG